MEELACKVARFLDFASSRRVGRRCVHTPNTILAAARRTNLPTWILEEAKKHHCGCDLARYGEDFVWDLMQRPECASEADHASLEKLWMQLGSRKLGRPFTRREFSKRWLVSQKARFERFDVQGLARR